jgi:hypothetical protein
MRFAAVILILSVTGCRDPGSHEPAERSPAEVDTLAQSESPVTPAAREDTLWIEGIPELVVLSPFRTDTFPIPFRTYLPPGWRAEEIPEERTVAFIPDGPLARQARLSIRAYPQGMTLQDAVERLHIRTTFDAEAPQQTTVMPAEDRAAWAITELIASAGPMVARAGLGVVDGRFFEVVSRYPVEAGDGFGPRAAIILSELRWLDTGKPLGQDAP